MPDTTRTWDGLSTTELLALRNSMMNGSDAALAVVQQDSSVTTPDMLGQLRVAHELMELALDVDLAVRALGL